MAALLLLVFVTSSVFSGASLAAPGTRVVVGGKNFTEQLLLSTITTQYLRALGYDAVLKNGLGSTLMRSALLNAQLDVVWEYTGTSLILYNKVTEKLASEAAYQRVRSLDSRLGLVWLKPSAIDNTYAIAMPRSVRAPLLTLSGLASQIRQDPEGTRHLLAMDTEFAGRSDGLQPLLALYRITLPRRDIKQMDPGLVYIALKNRQVMAGVVYTTDGRVAGFDLQLLKDDLHYFPSYTAVPVVRQAVLDANPLLAGQLDALSAVLDTATMTTLNKSVDFDGESIERVSRRFLNDHRLITN